MKLLRKIAVGLYCLLLGTAANAQSYYSSTEFGVLAGGAQYFGDLNDQYSFAYIRPAAGAFVRYHLNPFISVKATLLGARVGFDDKLSSNVYNRTRNLNFNSNVFELSAQAEFNFFRFATGEEKSKWTPYLTGGVGAFYFDPFTTYNGQRYYLKGLGTEGQNAGYNDRKYSNFNVCFPVGAGFKYWLSPGMNIGLELADRLTLTDYLDDVSTTYVGAEKFPNADPTNPNPAYILQDRSSEINAGQPLGRAGKQRGQSQTKDQYFTMLITLSFQLKAYRCPNHLKGDFVY